MNKENAKDSALRALSLFLLVASLAGLVWGWSVYKKTSNTAPNTTMTVSAEGKVTVKPDLAMINFSVVTQGNEPKSVQKINDGKMGAVIQYLKDSGIEEKDIKTTSYNLSPQYDYSWCNVSGSLDSRVYCPPKISGYILTQGVELKLRDLSKSGEIIGNLPGKGANEISSINFTIDDMEIPKIEARKEAIEKANTKALMMAEAAGVKLGKIANISEGSSYSPYPYATKSAEAYGLGGADASPIQVGSNDIVVNISITYQIK
jgi:uncharacterized protein